MKKFLKYGIMGILAAVISFLFLKPEKKEEKVITRNYEQIIRSGILRAVTEYNAFSYHAKDDTIGGFHYELLLAFARSKNLKAHPRSRKRRIRHIGQQRIENKRQKGFHTIYTSHFFKQRSVGSKKSTK